jgi:uncharacterized protein (DUF2252 family)
MNIVKATKSYEAWLSEYTTIVQPDLRLKHQRMAEDLFSFLRATFYRWVELWQKTCPDLARAPEVLAVGDLHVENFGTWRDVEGRLIWGINDFDEVYPAPYAIDLVRLAASAHFAIAAGHLAVSHKDACSAILEGYRKALAAGGEPFVLEEKHDWLRRVAKNELRNPVQFWQKMEALPRLKRKLPGSARKALERMMPEPGLKFDARHRVAGLGSLGRERYVALATWDGGRVAREAKALAPSACVWARGGEGSKRILYQRILRLAVRCRDPFVELKGRWIVRRLGPLCSRVELVSLPKERDELRLLVAMGWETANVHLGSPRSIQAVQRDLRRRPAGWLHEAAQQMVEATGADWREWKKKAMNSE